MKKENCKSIKKNETEKESLEVSNNIIVENEFDFIDYIDNESATDMGNRLNDKANYEKSELDKIDIKDDSSLEILTKKEENIIKRLENFDKYLKTVEYTLPKSVTFNGRTYTKIEIGDKIRKFINEKEVKWNYTLGMWQLWKFWKNTPDKISYGAYDSTLRTLGDCSFKGAADWENILIINDYFTQCNDAYAKDLTEITYLSTIHSNIINKIKEYNTLRGIINTDDNIKDIS